VLHPFFSSERPLVFAHRGGSALAPENTIAAFDAGLALGADGLELDVHLSRDGVVVVHHDQTLERTTNLAGPVAARTADELARADAGYFFQRRAESSAPTGDGWHLPADRPHIRDARRGVADQDGEFPFRGRGIGVPTLSAVLTRYPGVPIVIELKVNREPLAEAVVRAVRLADAVDRVCLGSFGLRVLREARRLEPDLATSASREEVRWARYRSRCRWPVKRVAYHGYQVPEWSGRTQVVSRRFVADAHAAGLGVQVWTVDTEADAARLLGWGADALITDRPDIMVPFVGGARVARD
jgi:glycerophosphoryl diester phosphodiesterase